MFSFAPTPTIHLFSHPTDMRQSFDGLSGLITVHLHKDPIKDGVFVFINKRRDRMKILFWDRHGFWLLYQRLEAGRFQLPPYESEHSPEALALAYEQLLMIIEGIDLQHVRRRKRYELLQIIS